MKLLRRASAPTEVAEPTPTVEPLGKGRPTPKRRDAAPKRQPLAAPRTTKEANQWRKQQSAQVRKGPSPTGKRLSGAEYREALKRGDESILPRRDKGEVRRLARDWVDSRHLASNYLLLAFPLLLVASEVKLPYRVGTYVTVAVFVLFACEWTYAGRQIHKLAVSRFGQVSEKPMALGMYAGQRAFLPRRWRTPGATLRPGDTI